MFIFLSICLLILLYFTLKEYHKRHFNRSMQQAQQYIQSLRQKEGRRQILQSLPAFTPEYSCRAVLQQQPGWLYADTSTCCLCFIGENLIYQMISADGFQDLSLNEKTQLATPNAASTLQNLPPTEQVTGLFLSLNLISSATPITLKFIEKPIEKTSYEYTQAFASAHQWRQLLQQMQHTKNKN